jgi:hypothetical protein
MVSFSQSATSFGMRSYTSEAGKDREDILRWDAILPKVSGEV